MYSFQAGTALRRPTLQVRFPAHTLQGMKRPGLGCTLPLIWRMKRRPRGERKQSTNFREATCFPFAVVQGAARQKNGLCEGVPEILGKANSNFDPAQTGSGTTTTTLRWLLIGAGCQLRFIKRLYELKRCYCYLNLIRISLFSPPGN